MTAQPAAVEVDPDRTATDLEQWFPGTSAWFGRSTGTWWALARDRAGESHLIEAATPAALVSRLDRLDIRRATPPATSTQSPAPAPRYSRARLAAVPDVTVPDLARVVLDAAAPVGPHQSRHRAPRRGWLRSAFAGLVAS